MASSWVADVASRSGGPSAAARAAPLPAPTATTAATSARRCPRILSPDPVSPPQPRTLRPRGRVRHTQLTESAGRFDRRVSQRSAGQLRHQLAPAVDAGLGEDRLEVVLDGVG